MQNLQEETKPEHGRPGEHLKLVSLEEPGSPELCIPGGTEGVESADEDTQATASPVPTIPAHETKAGELSGSLSYIGRHCLNPTTQGRTAGLNPTHPKENQGLSQVIESIGIAP